MCSPFPKWQSFQHLTSADNSPWKAIVHGFNVSYVCSDLQTAVYQCLGCSLGLHLEGRITLWVWD